MYIKFYSFFADFGDNKNTSLAKRETTKQTNKQTNKQTGTCIESKLKRDNPINVFLNLGDQISSIWVGKVLFEDVSNKNPLKIVKKNISNIEWWGTYFFRFFHLAQQYKHIKECQESKEKY